MKKQICVFAFLLLAPVFLLPQEASGGPREIKNLLSEVKKARAGDYIVLRSGRRYVLTQKEIDAANGKADYGDLSDVKTETRADGTEVKTLSDGHIAYTFKDGQVTHILKTLRSFTEFKNYMEEKYHIARFVDYSQRHNDSMSIGAPRFAVFRASAEFQKISNGENELESITIAAYNYKGESFAMRYCEQPDMVWGHISSEGAYTPTGESHRVEFDVE